MKLALFFLGGSLFSAAAVVLAGGRPAGMLWLGAVLALTTFGALVYLTGLRRVARFLNAFMDGIEGAQPVRTKSATQRVARPVIDRSNPMGYVKPSPKQRDQILKDTAAEYLGDDFDEAMIAPRVRPAVH
jgi:hypothetical protein